MSEEAMHKLSEDERNEIAADANLLKELEAENKKLNKWVENIEKRNAGLCQQVRERDKKIADLESLIGDAGFARHKAHCEEIAKLKEELEHAYMDKELLRKRKDRHIKYLKSEFVTIRKQVEELKRMIRDNSHIYPQIGTNLEKLIDETFDEILKGGEVPKKGKLFSDELLAELEKPKPEKKVTA